MAVYPSVRSSTSGDSFFTFSAALIPAMIPWQAASSYPDVPLICPARNSPAIFFVSSVRWSSVGSIESYSMAYPGRIISALSSPGIDFRIASCTSIGSEVLMPLT